MVSKDRSVSLSSFGLVIELRRGIFISYTGNFKTMLRLRYTIPFRIAV